MSILSVDFGSVHTRAILLDLVDGVYQLIAVAETRSTDGFPVNDIAVGLDRVLRELSETTGRVFTGEDGSIVTPESANRVGVDVFTASASIGRPLRAVVVGLYPDVSLASALRATSGMYVDVTTTISLNDGRDRDDRLNAVILNTPDVILIVGGTEDGAEGSVRELVDTVRLAVSLIDKSRRPTVIYAGNSALAAQLTTDFEELTKLLIAQNVRPAIEDEQLDSAQIQLARAFDLYKEERSQDFRPIAAVSAVGVLPTAQGYRIVADYLGKIRPGGVILVDIGSAASILAASFGGQVSTVIRTDLGLGHNALTLLRTAGLDAVRRWLPFPIEEHDLNNYAANKMLRPATVPGTLRDTYIEHALMRAGIETLLTAARPTWQDSITTKNAAESSAFGMIIGAGAALNGVGHPAYSALLLLDALQPTGISQLYADPFGLIPALGAVASAQPEAVVQVLDGTNLEPLGTAFSISGVPNFDKNALRVRITTQSGESTQQVVKGGHVWVFPLPAGQTATVRIRVLGRGTSIGGRRRFQMRVNGGTAGLIFDARGRVLPLAKEAKARAAQMPLWISEATGDPVIEIDPTWLEEAVPDEAQTAGNGRRARRQRGDQGQQPRRGLFGRRRKQAAMDEVPLDFEELDETDNDTADDPLRELRDASLS